MLINGILFKKCFSLLVLFCWVAKQLLGQTKFVFGWFMSSVPFYCYSNQFSQNKLEVLHWCNLTVIRLNYKVYGNTTYIVANSKFIWIIHRSEAGHKSKHDVSILKLLIQHLNNTPRLQMNFKIKHLFSTELVCKTYYTLRITKKSVLDQIKCCN